MTGKKASNSNVPRHMQYRSPWWLPGGNLQTIWPALVARGGKRPQFRRERLVAPDGDFIDVDHLHAVPEPDSNDGRPLLILFHGLEGSSDSHYAVAFADYAATHGWAYAVPHFRGCSGQINIAPRAYHSGDYQEIDWILKALTEGWIGSVWVAGISLGGNALLMWAAEKAPFSEVKVDALAAISAPLDLAACGRHMDRGFNRHVYVRNFLRTMQPRAVLKHQQYPGLFDLNAVMQAKTLYEFDDAFTAPLHGFKGTDDYWMRASSIHRLKKVTLPTLVLNAKNDPFVPESCLPRPGGMPDNITLYQPQGGGHVGFTTGHPTGHVRTLPGIVGGWLRKHS